MEETNSKSIGKGYGFYMPIAYALLALLLVVYILVAILYWNYFKLFFEGAQWWLVTLPVIAAIFWIFLFACMLKGADDKRTKMRQNAIYHTCEQVNKEYLKKSDVKTAVGKYGAWLEISYDPKKSKSHIILKN